MGLVHTSLRLGTQLLLFLQVIRTYLEQTGNSYRCPALQHVWRVNREGEVRESPPNPSPSLPVPYGDDLGLWPISESV